MPPGEGFQLKQRASISRTSIIPSGKANRDKSRSPGRPRPGTKAKLGAVRARILDPTTYSPAPNITIGSVGADEPLSGSTVIANALACTPARKRRIDHGRTAMRIGLEYSRGNRSAASRDQPQFISLLRRQRLEIAGQENQTRPVANINRLTLRLRRSLRRD